MPPTDAPKGSPADWLRRARSDLALAKCLPADEDILLEALCFHAQQAVEKAIKAVLISRSIVFPKTHNIGVLLELLPPEIARDAMLSQAASLTEYAVSARYPGEAEDVTKEELSAAIRLADRALAWAAELAGG
jgi:HEPN domain-containing protein